VISESMRYRPLARWLAANTATQAGAPSGRESGLFENSSSRRMPNLVIWRGLCGLEETGRRKRCWKRAWRWRVPWDMGTLHGRNHLGTLHSWRRIWGAVICMKKAWSCSVKDYRLGFAWYIRAWASGVARERSTGVVYFKDALGHFHELGYPRYVWCLAGLAGAAFLNEERNARHFYGARQRHCESLSAHACTAACYA